MKPYNQLKQCTGIPTRHAGYFFQTIASLFPNNIVLAFPIALIMICMGGKARAFEEANDLWPLIETQLEQQDTDSSYHFIFLLVRGHCGQNFNCLYPAYSIVFEKLERRFDLAGAIEVCNEMVRIAQKHGNLPGEANALMQLHRFHSALGNERQSLTTIDRAQKLYEEIGDQQGINRAKRIKLETRLNYEDISLVLPQMETLLSEMKAIGDSVNAKYLNLRLIHYSQWAGDYELMAMHIADAEKLMLKDPNGLDDLWFAIHTTFGRAELERYKKNLTLAEQSYQKALRWCREMPDPWLEIKTLQSLALLEKDREDFAAAKANLDMAQQKAEELNMDDHLTNISALQAELAEAEGRFEEALQFTKKKIQYEHQRENKSKGFDPESFYLQKEKEQLSIEKEKQQLGLKFKDARLRNLLITIGLGVLLIAALGLVVANQRRSKQKLALQHALIQQQAERLANLDAAKSRFFANISHELRTPLSLLLGPIGLLIRENKLNDRQEKLLRMARQSGHQLEQLVNEILDLGKMEMGKMGLNKKPTALHSFFHRYLLQFESLADRKNIHFTHHFNFGEKLTAIMDQSKCRQVLYNLLSNAFKFTPEGGSVSANFQFKDGTICLEVADNGSGIHPDDLPYLFDRYFQTNQTNKPASGGSGIGLALCHEYALLFGGKIEAESEGEGKGSVFRFQFPVEVVECTEAGRDFPLKLAAEAEATTLSAQPSSVLKEEPPPAPIANNDYQKPTILLVEDNPDLQEYIRLILQDKYNVVTADNGQSALAVLSPTVLSPTVLSPTVHSPTVHSPQSSRSSDGLKTDGLKAVDLVLSDLMMPVMDGYQLLENLKSNDATRHLPVIMLTARADVKDKLKALRLGVDDYLLKPFDEEELLARVDNMIKNLRMRQGNPRSETTGISHLEQSRLQAEHGDISQNTSPESQPDRPILSADDSEWLARLEENLQTELTQFDFKLEQLADLMLVSRRQLGRQVKALTGLTPSEYLLEARLQFARQLLDEGEVRSVKELAYSVGLRDAKHFSRQFRQRFGKSPTEVLEVQFC